MERDKGSEPRLASLCCCDLGGCVLACSVEVVAVAAAEGAMLGVEALL